MRAFKVSSSLKEKIENILTRRCIAFSSTEGRIEADCSGQIFHKIVLRAKMEKLMEEENSSIPYIAEAELNDRIVLDEVGDTYIVK